MTTTAADADASLRFPTGFLFGAATAAYQIEGAADEEGRGPSVWDTFSRTPGKVWHGDTGDVACDSYHRFRDDVALMASLGLRAYRFSVSWARVQPTGRGAINQKGLDYYRALVDELREHDIAPAATLFHWDLPQSLQDEGGWAVRSTAERFAEYAAIVAQVLGDAVERWITLNEPQVVASHGYRFGEHAPGLKDNQAATAANHHLLLAHGLAMQALRSELPAGSRVGITLDLHPVRVLGEGLADDVERARLITDAEQNGLYLEPVLHGRYPTHARPHLLPPAALVRDGDLALISQPSDFLGINYYAPVYLRPGDSEDLRIGESTSRSGVPGVVEYQPDWLARTPMDWLVDPDALRELLVHLSAEAPGLPLYVTENGCAAEDYVNPAGQVNDFERVEYLHRHLHAAHQAISEGANLAGYYVWSLLDNFEWAWGYQKRFGIVFVDFGTQQRTPKASAHFYAEVARSGALPPLPAR